MKRVTYVWGGSAEYYLFRPEHEKNTQSKRSFIEIARALYRFSPFINSATLFYLAIIISLVLSIFIRTSFVLFLSMIVVGAIMFIRTKKTALALSLERILPKNTREFDYFVVHYGVVNSGSSSCFGLRIEDTYGGTQGRKLTAEVIEDLASGEEVTVAAAAMNNAGMGVFDIGPSTVFVHDALGIFTFKVEFLNASQIVVLPKKENVNSPKLKISNLSLRYGIFENSSIGDSVSLRGIREYQSGDPLSHVAWKQSAKFGTPMVKEFDRHVNAIVHVYLNLKYGDHVGNEHESTWEMAKDACLALISNEIDQGSTVSFYTHGLVLKHIETKAAYVDLCHRILKLPLHMEAQTTSLQRFLESVDHGSAAIIISPHSNEIETFLAKFRRQFAHKKIQSYFVIVDLIDYLLKVKDKDEYLLTAVALLGQSNVQFASLIHRSGFVVGHYSAGQKLSAIRWKFGARR